MKKYIGKSAGFTIIELVVVVAIIGILASLVMVNVVQYIGNAKLAKATVEAENINKALIAFYTAYSDYPYEQCVADGCDSSYSFFDKTTGEPYLTVGGQQKHLSEFYKLDWDGYNADYFVKDGYYNVQLFDQDNDTKIGCGFVTLMDESFNFYGTKCIICQDCTCSSDPASGADCIDTVGDHGTSFSILPQI